MASSGTSAIRATCVASLLLVIHAFWTPAAAERLPATIYTTGQGLASDTVHKIVADSRGFIWIATREGLSRFDGYTFTNYGVDDGLPSAVVNDLLETRDGVYLVATAGGLARLETTGFSTADSGGQRPAVFTVHPISPEPRTQYVTTLYENSDGVWVGTRAGLFRLHNPSGTMAFRPVVISAEPNAPPVWVWRICEDRFGSMWIATVVGLRRLWRDGRIETHFPEVGVHVALEDRAGRVWAGTRLHGLLELTLDDSNGRVIATRVFTNARERAEQVGWSRAEAGAWPHSWISDLLEVTDGELWAASPGGIIQLTQRPGGSPRIELLGAAQGLARDEVWALARDRAGNLWAGTYSGVVKIASSGFSTFGPDEGIAWGNSLMQTRSGHLCFVGSGAASPWGLHCFNGASFDAIHPRSPRSLSWGWNQLALEDRSGAWWFATSQGIARFAPVKRPHSLQGSSPARWYRKVDGLAQSVILRIFEDSRGDVWIAPNGEGGRNGLSRWDRATDSLRHYTAEPNLPDLDVHFPTAFGEDASGTVWIGFSGTGGVARYRNGTFERPDTHGLVRAQVRNIFSDSAGRIWVATFHGVVRVDDPGGDAPAFRGYTTRDGLSSNEITAVTEDPKGRLYLGTGKGVDRLEPDTGRIRRFTARDGFTPGEVSSALLDRRTGHLWFAQRRGLSRLVPPPEPAPAPPPILITAVEIAAEPQPLNPLGETALTRLRVEPHRNHLRIDYVALGFAPGEDLRYQYRLEGSGNDWSAPSIQRSVNFASLAPGSYQFVVRALSADGIPSAQPAIVEFTIVPPVWQRWWSLSLAGAAAALLVYAAYRYRLTRALEIASVRTRIATDLHDDIGANLTKIAILSEVARQQLEGQPAAGERLSTIARISRESVASMSDVVWAINPRRDTLLDTIRRMRQHAEEMLAGRGIELVFQAPEDQKFRVRIDVRRDFLLVFKEALNNAVRHSQCRKVEINIRVDGSALQLRVTDDGVGFDTNLDPGGNGLASMRRRAARIDATLDVVSAPGYGTTVLLCVPASTAPLRRPA